MAPRIVFLGTGGDAIVVGKGYRAAGGIIIEVDDNQLHIDPGPGALVRATDYGISPRNNVAVLVSHAHLNHCNDVNAIISAMSLGGLDPKGVLIANKTSYNGTESYEPVISKHSKKMIERSIILEEGKRVGINEVEIRATYAMHSDEFATGYKIITSKFALGYSSDTGYCHELIESYKDVDIMILNCVHESGKKDKNNLGVDDVIKLLPEIKPKLAIITHFGIKLHKKNILSEVRKIQRETKIQTIAAKDGLVINPTSYSVSLRQKTLNLY